MRLIDADALEKILADAIMIQEGMAVALGIEKDEGVQMELKAYRDILNGVKEQPTINPQEPVQPERAYSGGGSTWWNVCGACKTAINPNDKYCHECGRAVDWE